MPDSLPHAQRRLLEVLRVLAMDSKILLLDEPAAGLSPEERHDLRGRCCASRDELGKTIVLVEHDLDLVWRVADRITVLDAGAVIAEGVPARDPDRSARARPVRRTPQGAMLEMRNLHSGYGRVPVLRDISLQLRPGEVLLVLGANGAGKSTLLRTIVGLHQADARIGAFRRPRHQRAQSRRSCARRAFASSSTAIACSRT